MKLNEIIKNISYAFSANFISFGISICMVIFLPKFLSLEDYGMWQLFLFYFSYLGFLHFGWEDGIYLRYAGKKFEELKMNVFSGQIYGIVVLQIMLTILLIGWAEAFIEDYTRRVVFICAVSLAVFVNFNNACNLIMQITNKIKEYARLILIERLVLLMLIFSSLAAGLNHFYNMYLAKVGSLCIASAVCCILCKPLLKPKFSSFQNFFSEAFVNIEVGIKLMFANIASMLIIGIIRYGISLGWDITTFGKVSLTLNISNFFMIFISSVSVVFFPILKRMNSDKLSNMYVNIRNMLGVLLFGMFLFYYPVKKILSWWLPTYADSLIYMAVLFPICLFESKVSLLINTYLKSMRKEELLLKINVISVMVAIVITFVTVKILHDLNATVFSIVFLYAFRCELAEIYIERLLSIKLKREIVIEILMVTVFVVSGIALNSWLSTFAYGLAYVIYLALNKNQIRNLQNQLHKL